MFVFGVSNTKYHILRSVIGGRNSVDEKCEGTTRSVRTVHTTCVRVNKMWLKMWIEHLWNEMLNLGFSISVSMRSNYSIYEDGFRWMILRRRSGKKIMQLLHWVVRNPWVLGGGSVSYVAHFPDCQSSSSASTRPGGTSLSLSRSLAGSPPGSCTLIIAVSCARRIDRFCLPYLYSVLQIRLKFCGCEVFLIQVSMLCVSLSIWNRLRTLHLQSVSDRLGSLCRRIYLWLQCCSFQLWLAIGRWLEEHRPICNVVERLSPGLEFRLRWIQLHDIKSSLFSCRRA